MTCLFMGILIVLEAEWEESLMNQMHFVNEFGFYLLLCFLVCFCGLVHDETENNDIGRMMIGLICLLIAYNIGVIFYDMLHYLKLHARRYKFSVIN